MNLYAAPDANPTFLEALRKRGVFQIIQVADSVGFPADPDELCLVLSADGLALTQGKLQMSGDLSAMLPRLRPNNLTHEMLVKACRIKGLDHPVHVLDATAGMGEDSLLLAAAGFYVDLYEYDPVICSLLEASLIRAAENPELMNMVSRMKAHFGSSIEAMKCLKEAPDVVFLDPMFPARSKSGMIKKKFQLLQQLESPCSDEREMFEAAVGCHPRRIVIKRPAKGPWLADRKPDYSLMGKAIRYDCIILNADINS